MQVTGKEKNWKEHYHSHSLPELLMLSACAALDHSSHNEYHGRHCRGLTKMKRNPVKSPAVLEWYSDRVICQNITRRSGKCHISWQNLLMHRYVTMGWYVPFLQTDLDPHLAHGTLDPRVSQPNDILISPDILAVYISVTSMQTDTDHYVWATSAAIY